MAADHLSESVSGPGQKRSTKHQPDIQALFEYVERRDKDEQGFMATIVAMYQYNASWSNGIIRMFVDMLAIMLRPRRHGIRYLFWGCKFEEIILNLPKNEVCVIGGPKQLLFCLKHKRQFLPCMRLWQNLTAAMADKDLNTAPAIEREITNISRQLARIAREDAVLVVDNDSLPMQRTMVLAARNTKILQTICIQDGIFQSRSPGHIMHGKFCERFFVINQQQKEMLIQKGMDASKIKVMGFYSSPYLPRRSTSPVGRRTVCFLGQPWSKYGVMRANRYQEIVGRIGEILRSSGLEMRYKPHPWERGSDYLSVIKNVVDISLHKAFENYDVFISMTSTALIEAQAAGRVAIQIMDSHFDADDLSAQWMIVMIDANKEHEWQDELLAAINAPVSTPKHIRSPVTRFLEALESEQ